MTTLKDKIEALRLVWGEEKIREAQSYAWEYAIAESAYLQLASDMPDKGEYQRRIGLLARIRTTETIDSITELTKRMKKQYKETTGKEPDMLTIVQELENEGIVLEFKLKHNFEELFYLYYTDLNKI